MMKHCIGPLVAIVATLGMTAAAHAGPSAFEECKAVKQTAQIDYDARMIVNVYEDRDAPACYFTVNLEPAAGETQDGAPVAAATMYANLALDPPSDLEPAARAITQDVISGLMAPLSLSKSDTGFVNSDLREKRFGDISACIVDTVAKQIKFEQRTDVISCGLNEVGSFILQAEYDALRLAMIIPAPRKP